MLLGELEDEQRQGEGTYSGNTLITLPPNRL